MTTCPIPGCSRPMAVTHVLCRTHWFTVSKETREAVWNEYRHAPRSPEHVAAVRQAIEEAMR